MGRFGFSSGWRRIVTIFWALVPLTVLTACGLGANGVLTDEGPIELEHRLYTFPDGAVFADSFAGREVKLLFGGASAQQKVEVTFSVPSQERDNRRDYVRGVLDSKSCTFRLSETTSAGLSPLLERDIIFDRCDLDEAGELLTLVREQVTGEDVSATGVGRRIRNVVVILTDDQRWDTMFAMPNTQNIAENGMTFSRSYVTIPNCCPFRASFLSGGFLAHNTNVVSNQWPDGGGERFDDSISLATRLYDLGYRTGLIGKYLNGMSNVAPRIPQGWTEFVGNLEPGTTNEREKSWSDYWVLEGSRWPHRPVMQPSSEGPESGILTHVVEYSTDYELRRALAFLDDVGNSPFFLYIAVRAPHLPATPANEDLEAFSDFEYSGRALGEEDLSDKPAWIRFEAEQLYESLALARKDFPRNSLRSLQAVDRLVREVDTKLRRMHLIEDTLVVFTSDSGIQWFEHRLGNKALPYEETLKVPFIVWGAGTPSGVDDHLVAVNLDLAATVLDVAGSDARTEGVSLRPHLKKGAHQGRQFVFFEQYPIYFSFVARKERKSTELLPYYFSGLRVSDERGEWKFVRHATGEIELYDLERDPYEMESLHGKSEYQNLIADLERDLRPLEGLGIITLEIPDGIEGRPFSYQLRGKGGTEPYAWAIISGGNVPGIRARRQVGPLLDGLPPGLSLDETTGVISGIPREPGEWDFVVQLTDHSTSHRTLGHQQHFMHLQIAIRKRG